ncbi:hypothetical protein KY360_02520 [Candidatus Woesearchaeota archaeon]|nr:hypothetical protein [Candidatus Woesearchaeota archaeon]
MTVSEIIAVIFAVIILVKIVVLMAVKPKKIIKFADKMIAKPVYNSIAFLVIIAVLGWLLLKELSIVQIMAASLFGIFVYALALVQYPKQLDRVYKVILKNQKKMWLSWLVWLVLAVWVLKTVFFCTGA